MTEVAAAQPAGDNGPQEGPADWRKQLNLPAKDTRVQTEVNARRLAVSWLTTIKALRSGFTAQRQRRCGPMLGRGPQRVCA